MKSINLDILPFQESSFFSPMREKIDYVRVLMHTSRKLLLQVDILDEIEITSTMKLLVDKMNRVFFYKEGKYFSIAFPFSVQIHENQVTQIETYTGKVLDFKSISAVLSIIESEEFKINPSLIDLYIEPHSISPSGMFLLEELFQAEPSYIRYDNDPDRENGRIHPINHLDINYSSYGTYKIGLNNVITSDFFENTLRITTECKYII